MFLTSSASLASDFWVKSSRRKEPIDQKPRPLLRLGPSQMSRGRASCGKASRFLREAFLLTKINFDKIRETGIVFRWRLHGNSGSAIRNMSELRPLSMQGGGSRGQATGRRLCHRASGMCRMCDPGSRVGHHHLRRERTNRIVNRPRERSAKWPSSRGLFGRQKFVVFYTHGRYI